MYYTKEIIKGDVTKDTVFDFEEGQQTSDTKLSYKGKVYNGKLILTSSSAVVMCIDDGTYYAYKEQNSDEVISGIGTCLYDGTTGDFDIVTDEDTELIQKQCDEDKKELQEQINKLTTDVNNLNATINDKNHEITTLEGTISSLESTITSLEAEKQALIDQLANNNTSNSDLQQQIATLQGEITTLRGTIDSLNATITTLEGEKQDLIDQLAASNATNSALQAQITDLNNKITTLENEKADLEDQLDESNETNSNLQTQITNLNSQITTLKAEKEELTERLAASNSELQEEIDELNEEIETLKGTISTHETTIKNLTTEKNSLTAQLATANSRITELEGTIATLESSLEAKNNEITTLNGEKTALQTSLTAKTNELSTLNTKLAKVTATATDVLTGKTILASDGTLVTGTMANKAGTTTAATTVTKNGDTALITIPANGYYSTSSKISVPVETIQTVAGDRLYLYKDGNQYTSTTGGWAYQKICSNGGAATFNSDHILLTPSYNGTNNQYAIYTKSKINLTGYKHLTVVYDGETINSSHTYTTLSIYINTSLSTSPSEIPSYNVFVQQRSKDTTFTDRKLVLSFAESTSAYIYIHTAEGRQYKIKEVYLEK